jgi:hypothetical protein
MLSRELRKNDMLKYLKFVWKQAEDLPYECQKNTTKTKS